ncbi:MAG: CDGSH iron-sulfur domain-containing protein [Prolixibacteraceae bacterium]|nr:CDGSH iron-sulfur domain-containing protein [Prolixibacteraceae bacterium]MBN2775291.1 CDGSH iron-sulfur domain-containing protein [Prolixibacteraceae bacterium]
MEKPIIAAKKPAVVELGPGTYFWCACGRSSNQPFCNGSHKGTGIVPQSFKIEEKKTVFLCQCKQSGNKPFCDGTHREL